MGSHVCIRVHGKINKKIVIKMGMGGDGGDVVWAVVTLMKDERMDE